MAAVFESPVQRLGVRVPPLLAAAALKAASAAARWLVVTCSQLGRLDSQPVPSQIQPGPGGVTASRPLLACPATAACHSVSPRQEYRSRSWRSASLPIRLSRTPTELRSR